MPKDRNSMAKRQREADKQRRTQEKKDRRDQRKSGEPGEDASTLSPHIELSSDEIEILQTFAQFLMPPDQMLCLSNTELPATKRALEKLIGRGLLISNDFKSGYSMTVEGFETMQRLQANSSARK